MQSMTQILAVIMLVFIGAVIIRSVIQGSSFKKVIAHVIEVEVSQRTAPEDNTQYTAYVPIYEYEVDGTKYTARGSVSRDHPAYNVGDTREIIYNTKDPNEVHLRRHNKNKSTIGIVLIIFGIALAAIAFLYS